jgi:hypothetical protein
VPFLAMKTGETLIFILQARTLKYGLRHSRRVFGSCSLEHIDGCEVASVRL